MLLPENEYVLGEKMRTEEGDMNAEHSKYNGGFMLSSDPTKDRLAGRDSTARASSIISVVGSQRKPDPAPELALQ